MWERVQKTTWIPLLFLLRKQIRHLRPIGKDLGGGCGSEVYTFMFLNRHLTLPPDIMDSPVNARWVSITVADKSSGSAFYLHLGNIWINKNITFWHVNDSKIYLWVCTTLNLPAVWFNRLLIYPAHLSLSLWSLLAPEFLWWSYCLW